MKIIKYKFKFLFLIIWLSSAINTAFSQLSPGKLSKAHSHLEGLNNCTSCHDLGSTVSGGKCLDCHKPLKEKIQKNRGYHVSKEVKGKSCISCHSDHHGVNFQMVRFNTSSFNHNLAGYALKGKHATIDCKACHQSSNIADSRLKSNSNTFLGLETACVSCHKDYHQKTLGQDCAKCHNYDSFSPASYFNHSKTSFQLKGAHAKVDCASCHKTETRNGQKFQRFADVPHANCNACHADPHKGNFGTNCKSCHNENSFRDIKSSGFNHNLTGFHLVGKHKSLDCATCHSSRSAGYKEFSSHKNIDCITCHKDVHEGKFGLDCKSCHNENSFKMGTNRADFNHDLTDFKLEGMHEKVDCRACHVSGNMTKDLTFNTCNACHKDYHNGQFTNTPYKDCAQCHTVNSFKEALFSLESHQTSAFPLNGAHMATDCAACHLKDSRWEFRNIGNKCIDCHDNFHEGFMDQKFIPNNDCTHCHNAETWSAVSFDHAVTKFNLEGRHLETKCSACHFLTQDNKVLNQQFSGISQECVSCHDNIHGDQFALNSITDCKRCHEFERWTADLFNHDSARFVLEGAHQNLTCNNCHKPEVLNGTEIVVYRTGNLLCLDCHQ